MTNKFEATDFSLADFYQLNTDNPLDPSEDWREWRRQASWATSLYEQSLLDGPRSRTRLNTTHDRQVINMASYDYLGMANDARVIAGARAALERYGTGACGSPLLSGMTDLHRTLESRLAGFLGREDCMLFSSGYGGALGMMAGLLRRDDVALLDEKSHVSLVDGARLSNAKLVFYRHNDAASLDEMLSKFPDRRRLIVLEGIYSMDGDIGDLPAIGEVAKRHGVGVVIDEAHSILALGKHGRGAVEHFDAEDSIVLQYATFSKAFAGVGGFISGPKSLLEYLRYFAGSYGFSCALPPSVVGGILAVLDIVATDPGPRHRLWKNAATFREGLKSLGIDTGQSTSQVVPVIIGDNRKRLYELGLELRAAGLFMAPVDYPSVPEDALRFRASVTAAHSDEDLARALDIISTVVVPRLREV